MTPSRKPGVGMLLTWGPTILFNVILPIVTYNILTDNGMKSVNALLLISLWPVVDLIVYYALNRRLDEFALLTLAFMLLGVAGGLIFHSEHLLLVKDSLITGLFGVVLLATLLMSRPLMFHLGRKFATDGSDKAVAEWNGMWQYEGFRNSQRFLTIVWGVAFLAEAVLRVVLAYAVSTSVAQGVGGVTAYAVTGGLIFWTVAYGKRKRAAAERNNPNFRGGATADPAAPATP